MLYDPNWSPPQTEIKLERWQQLMLKAADLIEEQGWVTKAFHIPHVGFCMMGALRAFTEDGRVVLNLIGPPEFSMQEYHKAASMLQMTMPRDTPTIAAWNDFHARDKAHVVAKLREVAHAV